MSRNLSAALLLVCCTAFSGSTQHTLRIDRSNVTLSDRCGWSSVSLPQALLKGEPGEPLLPCMPAVLVLPAGATNPRLSCRLSRPDTLMVASPLRPAHSLRPLSSGAELRLNPDPELYASGEWWEPDPIVWQHAGSLSGFEVFSCLVRPWHYHPGSGRLVLFERADLEVTWDCGTVPCRTDLQIQAACDRLECLVDNPGDLHGSAPASRPRGLADTDYLVVADREYLSLLQPLADMHSEDGLSCEVVAVQDLLASHPGEDDAEKLREAIRDYHQNMGTLYVLLAGDETLVPDRLIRTECEYVPVEYAPVDLYFSDLDGDWDANGDGIYGQPEDDLDLYADVLLGRALFSTQAEADLFVDKNLTYQSSPPEGDWSTRALLCGAVMFEELGYVGAKGADSMDTYIPDSWNTVKAYQTLDGDGIDTHVAVLDSGTAWNYYAGHGNDRGVYWSRSPMSMITNWIADTLSNGEMAGIHTSIACHPGDFEEDRCCAEALLNCPTGGAVSVTFNTTYGWEGYWPDLGPSEMMCIELARQVFQIKQRTIGLAFAASKDFLIPFMHDGYDRIFQSLLSWSAFHDPALRVLNVPTQEGVPPVPLTVAPPWPNPATRMAPVRFFVDFTTPGPVDISVHDLTGRLVWRDRIYGRQLVCWDGCQSDGRRVRDGVYLISVRQGNSAVTRKVTVLD
ncbi:hypothetical protein GF402_02690 [Candidatus Fermentibacteria bacterium]|nr:hypothetical protein [Candidatus Fermentibacteria bacterium]